MKDNVRENIVLLNLIKNVELEVRMKKVIEGAVGSDGR